MRFQIMKKRIQKFKMKAGNSKSKSPQYSSPSSILDQLKQSDTSALITLGFISNVTKENEKGHSIVSKEVMEAIIELLHSTKIDIVVSALECIENFLESRELREQIVPMINSGVFEELVKKWEKTEKGEEVVSAILVTINAFLEFDLLKVIAPFVNYAKELIFIACPPRIQQNLLLIFSSLLNSENGQIPFEKELCLEFQKILENSGNNLQSKALCIDIILKLFLNQKIQKIPKILVSEILSILKITLTEELFQILDSNAMEIEGTCNSKAQIQSLEIWKSTCSSFIIVLESISSCWQNLPEKKRKRFELKSLLDDKEFLDNMLEFAKLPFSSDRISQFEDLHFYLSELAISSLSIVEISIEDFARKPEELKLYADELIVLCEKSLSRSEKEFSNYSESIIQTLITIASESIFPFLNFRGNFLQFILENKDNSNEQLCLLSLNFLGKLFKGGTSEKSPISKIAEFSVKLLENGNIAMTAYLVDMLMEVFSEEDHDDIYVGSGLLVLLEQKYPEFKRQIGYLEKEITENESLKEFIEGVAVNYPHFLEYKRDNIPG